MKEVFISYSSANTKEATKLLRQLELMDISCWMAPRELIPSANYAAEITEAIKEATFFVVLVSKESQASDQVINEIAIATHHKKKIISYLLDDTPLNSGFEYYLRSRHWIDAGTDPLTAMTKLAHLIRETRNGQSEKPRSKETMEAERQGTEAIFMLVRVGVVMVTLILWLVAVFLLHGMAYGTPLYTAGLIIATVVEVLLIVLLLAPVFGGSGKLAKTIFRELINAFKGDNK